MERLRFLIVDDDDLDRERVRRLLEKLHPSCETIEVGSGAETRQILTQYSFDCIFLDYRLGDCYGTELVADIRNIRGDEVPIIIITGRGDERVAVDAMRVGVYDYISKINLDVGHLEAAIAGGMHSMKLRESLASAHERLQLSMFDTLTGLANRDLFNDRLTQAIHLSQREGREFALLIMDLNLFKEINDTLGHAIGDVVLGEIGQRLQSLVRTSDTVARLGGDEFGMILAGSGSVDVISAVVQKIVDHISEPIMVGDEVVLVGISIGGAFFPHDAEHRDSLVACADAAMYRAKRGDLGYAFHVETEETTARLMGTRMIASLEKAIKFDELYLEYQPKIRLTDGGICGVEALVRWQSPEFGHLRPDDFIPAAERSEAIQHVSRCVFEHALAQAKKWFDAGVFLPVSVNVSARLLNDDKLPDQFAELLTQYALPPSILTVELTETALVASPEQKRLVLEELATLGIQVSIDDFGTGYTSLRYLREFEIAEIKIDKVFVTGLTQGSRDEAIVRSIIALGQNFDVPVVAEGIEKNACLVHLRNLGCSYGQGFRISHPLKAADVLDWVKTRGRASIVDVA
jgi:diguanylate cyclase (GGDEF)-like protein